MQEVEGTLVFYLGLTGGGGLVFHIDMGIMKCFSWELSKGACEEP